jgi:hypothetical protein
MVRIAGMTSFANRATVVGVAEALIDRPEMFVKGKKHVSSVGEVGDTHDLTAGMHR